MTPRSYDDLFKSPGGALISFHEVSSICEMLDYPREKSILDVGTGTGRVAVRLIELGNEVCGIDVNRDRIRAAVLKAKNKCKYHVILANGEHIPVKSDSVDLAVCIKVLKYFKKPIIGLAEIARTLKPDGLCIIEISNSLGYENPYLTFRRILSQNRYAPEMGPRYNLFNPFEMKDVIQSLGLSIQRIIGWHRIPPAIFKRTSNRTVLRILYLLELALEKILPNVVLSRGILFSCRKIR
ncbi:MAG: class I SAM-dependent methyltransferase [Candidatus Thorarchaeota archaeon]